MRKAWNTRNLWKIICLFGISLLFCMNSNASVPEDKVLLMKEIFNDPMLPDYMHGAELTVNRKDSDKVGTNYSLRTAAKVEVPGVFAIHHRESKKGNFDEVFVLFDSPTSDQYKKDINWDAMQEKWTIFVKKYWPSVERVSDWHDQRYRYSGRGVFTMDYVEKEQGVDVLKVSIEIGLGDGKVRGFYERDYRNLLEGYKVPPEPSDDDIMAATKKALARQTSQKFSNFEIDGKSRGVKQFLPTNSSPQEAQGREFAVIDSVAIKALDENKVPYDIYSNYDAEKKTAFVNAYVHIEPDVSSAKLQRQKPLTQVDDKSPSWSADGKRLYFITSRDAKDRGWWDRGTVAFQYAIAVNQVGTDKLQYISPLKTNKRDYGLYQSPQISHDGRYLAAGLGSDNANLFVLDLQVGNMFIPERDPAILVRQQKTLGLPEAFLRMTQSMFRSDGNKSPWISKGFQWLPNGNFLHLGWIGESGEQIFLAKKTSTEPGKVWDLWPLHQERGEDVLLCLSSDAKVLSWAHQDAPPTKAEREKGDNAPRPWQLATADFDSQKPELSNLIKTNLPDKPTSISWDSKNNRWLIVTEKNELLWAQKNDGKLTITKVLLALTWNDNKLQITSAAVAPDGTRIALTAELENPISYEKTECVVRSMIFDWDGKSTFVKPFYDPSINGIPRYTFPATKNTWAKIDGNVKKLGLQDIIDPAFVESAK